MHFQWLCRWVELSSKHAGRKQFALGIHEKLHRFFAKAAQNAGFGLVAYSLRIPWWPSVAGQRSGERA
jgi:hypothetical protein